MYETEKQIEELQALMDRSFQSAGPHLLSISTPERRLSARQVVRYLQGVKHIAVATVSRRGEPRVSAVDGLFLRGVFHFGTGADSLRIRHLRRNRSISATHLVGEDVAITVHGTATIIERSHPDAAVIDAVWRELYGFSALDPAAWQSAGLSPDIVFVRVEPRLMFTFASHPEAFPE